MAVRHWKWRLKTRYSQQRLLFLFAKKNICVSGDGALPLDATVTEKMNIFSSHML
jgi:hypothetical protein